MADDSMMPTGATFAVDLSKPYAKRRSDEPRSHYAQRLQFVNALVADDPGLSDERVEVLSNCYTNVKFLNNRYNGEIMKILEKYDPEVRLITQSQQTSIAHIKTPK
jgi:hypothetical protein